MKRTVLDVERIVGLQDHQLAVLREYARIDRLQKSKMRSAKKARKRADARKQTEEVATEAQEAAANLQRAQDKVNKLKAQGHAAGGVDAQASGLSCRTCRWQHKRCTTRPFGRLELMLTCLVA